MRPILIENIIRASQREFGYELKLFCRIVINKGACGLGERDTLFPIQLCFNLDLIMTGVCVPLFSFHGLMLT